MNFIKALEEALSESNIPKQPKEQEEVDSIELEDIAILEHHGINIYYESPEEKEILSKARTNGPTKT
jgi:hypothetical protein